MQVSLGHFDIDSDGPIAVDPTHSFLWENELADEATKAVAQGAHSPMTSS